MATPGAPDAEAESESITVPTAAPPNDHDEQPEPPADPNEPPAESVPYAVAEDDPSQHQGYHSFQQPEDPNAPLIIINEPESSGTIPIDLSNRETRLTLWAVTFFIWAICEFTANNILAKQSSYLPKLKAAYQTWAASDFFLMIGASLLWTECNPTYILDDITGNMNENNVHKILRYIIAGLLILGGILRWIALGQHNDVMCDGSRCNSWHFAQDFMATWFSLVIGIETLDILELIKTDQRCLRMIIYCSLLILMSMIVFSDLDYNKRQYNGSTGNCENCYNDYSSIGWFLVLFMLIVILIIAILVMIHKYDGLMNNNKLKKYVHFGIVVVMMIGLGLVYYSFAILSQTMLAIVAVLMVAFDFLSLP